MQMREAAGQFLRRWPQAPAVGTHDQGSELLMTRTSAKKVIEGSMPEGPMFSDVIGPHSSLFLALVSTLTDHLLLEQPSPQDANSSAAHTLQAPSSQTVASLTDWTLYLSMTNHCGQELHALAGQSELGLRSSTE